MSIRLDSDKCWVCNPAKLKIKRYLSDTRSYFREGAWIRTGFKRFFPEIKVDPEGKLYYDLRSLTPECVAVKGENLKETRLPKDLVEQFQASIQEFAAELKTRSISFNEEVSVKEFTLPDPEIHPELYWLVESDTGHRLVILWGLETEDFYSNYKLEEIGKRLEEKFVGRIGQKHKKESPVVPAPVQPVVSSPVIRTPENKPQPIPATPAKVQAEQGIIAPKVKNTAVAQEPRVPQATTPKISGKPEKAPFAVQPVQVEKLKKHSKPGKPVSEWISPKTRTIFTRSIGGIAALLLLTYAVAGISYLYIGKDIRMEVANTKRSNISFELPPNQDALLPGGLKLPAAPENRTVCIPGLSKSGVYRIELLHPETQKTQQTLEFTYKGLRNDFADHPVANLLINRPNTLLPNEEFAVYTGASFHESSETPLELQISWGDSNSGFETIQDSKIPLTHQYTEPGNYRISLLAKDANGRWDYDVVELLVVDRDAPSDEIIKNMAPIVDAEIVSVLTVEKTQEVTINVAESFDPDGRIKSLEIDWDDASKPQLIAFPATYVSHRYQGQPRADIRIKAVDNLGRENEKPALLFVDFQSKHLRDTERYAALPDDQKLARILIPEQTPDDLRLIRKEYAQIHRNKQHLVFELLNPENRCNCPLLNVEWTLQGPDDYRATVNGTSTIDTYLVDGVYKLTVSALTPDGNQLSTEHRISVSVAKEMSPLTKIADWLSHRLISQKLSAKL